jgi:hypothetical protein
MLIHQLIHHLLEEKLSQLSMLVKRFGLLPTLLHAQQLALIAVIHMILKKLTLMKTFLLKIFLVKEEGCGAEVVATTHTLSQCLLLLLMTAKVCQVDGHIGLLALTITQKQDLLTSIQRWFSHGQELTTFGMLFKILKLGDILNTMEVSGITLI